MVPQVELRLWSLLVEYEEKTPQAGGFNVFRFHRVQHAFDLYQLWRWISA